MLRGPADPDKFRIKVGRYSERWYHDPLPTCPIAEASDESWPAMTTVLNAWPKFLTDWAARQSAEWAYDNRKAWVELDRDEAVPLIAGAHKRERDRAADRGTQVHSIFEAVANGEHLDPMLYPEAQEFLPAVTQVLDDLQPTWLLSEVVVINRSVGFGGTLDTAWRTAAFGDMAIDFKSRKDHSVYNDKATQIAGYAGAEYAIVEHEGQARRIALPAFDQAVLITITPDDYRIHPVSLELGGEAIVAVKRFWTAQGARLVGKPLHVERANSQPTEPGGPGAESGAGQGGGEAPAAPRVPQEVSSEGAPTPSPDRRTWIIGRVTAIANAGHLDALGAAWPEGVPTFRQADTHSDAEIDAIARACSTVEKAHGLAFPEIDPAAEAAMAKIPADDPRIVELGERVTQLPTDLVEELARRLDGKVKLSSGRATAADLEVAQLCVQAVETIRDNRLTDLTAALEEWDGLERQALATSAGLDPTRLHLASHDELTKVRLLSEALGTGYLVAGSEGYLIASATCEQLLTTTVHAGKAKALNHTKRLAKAHGVVSPTSFADVLGDPLWIALCICDPDQAAPAAA